MGVHPGLRRTTSSAIKHTLTQVIEPALLDSDADGVPYALDNCILVPNYDQRDTDGDGYGNLCDADLNNSGEAVNYSDLSVLRTAFNTGNPDADFDGNGLVNYNDLAVFRKLFGKLPGPSGLQQP